MCIRKRLGVVTTAFGLVTGCATPDPAPVASPATSQWLPPRSPAGDAVAKRPPLFPPASLASAASGPAAVSPMPPATSPGQAVVGKFAPAVPIVEISYETPSPQAAATALAPPTVTPAQAVVPAVGPASGSGVVTASFEQRPPAPPADNAPAVWKAAGSNR